MESLSETTGRRLNTPPDYEEASYYCHNSLPIRSPPLDRHLYGLALQNMVYHLLRNNHLDLVQTLELL